MSSVRGDQRPPSANSVYSALNMGVGSHLDVPGIRIPGGGGEERSASALSAASSVGSTQDDLVVGSGMSSWLVRGSLAAMVVSALLVQLVGQSVVFRLTEMLGFVLLFTCTFLFITGVYCWWAVLLAGHTSGLDSMRSIRTYGVCCASELIATLANYVVDLGVLESFPIDIAFYSALALALLSLFAGLVHKNGIASMFGHETTSFVMLTLVIHYCVNCLFDEILPSILYSQLVYTGCFLALSLSLLIVKYPKYFTLTSFKRIVRSSIQSAVKAPSVAQGASGRRFSTASVISTMSSVPPRSSLTSQSSHGTSVMTGNNFDIDTLNEAHGILGDLLFQEDRLTKKGKESLKHIQDLLAPRVSRTVQLNSRGRINSNVSEEESDASSIGVNPHMYGFMTPKSHRKSIRNVSSQFTTTTTATGLPNVDQDPTERKRSVAPRDLKARISLVEGRPSVHQLQRPFSRDRLGSLPLQRSSLAVSHSREPSDVEMSETAPDTPRQPVATISGSSDSGTESQLLLKTISENGGIRRKSEGTALIPKRKIGLSKSSSVEFPNSIGEESQSDSPDLVTETEELPTPLVLNAPSLPCNKVALFNTLVVPPRDYQLSDYQHSNIEVLEHVMEWDFPIFELEEVAGNHILSQMAYCLFMEAGLIDTFKIPQREFINYFRILEANYGPNTYHNKTHAADVLHATSYLLFEEIPEFSYEISRSADREWVGQQRRLSGIATALSILEVFACFMGAAMHDFDHPGRTNAFLVATKNPLAVLYNDKSVLENHHAAASWDLLTSLPENNFLTDFEETELKRFRFLLIECILATDLKLHFDIVRDFKGKTEDGQGIDWSSDIERLQMMKMVIKMADINTSTKSFDLHRAWTKRITEEFFQQSDEEMKLGLPQTIFMSRSEKHKLPSIQVSFIQNLVSPLFHACAQAGVIPGILETENSNSMFKPDNVSDDDSETADEEDSIPDEAASASNSVGRKVVSIILTNLDMNFNAWQSEVPTQQQPPSSDKTAAKPEDEDN